MASWTGDQTVLGQFGTSLGQFGTSLGQFWTSLGQFGTVLIRKFVQSSRKFGTDWVHLGQLGSVWECLDQFEIVWNIFG